MLNLLKVLMKRDSLTEKEANERVTEMKKSIQNGDDPEDVLYEEGLEPDYIFDLLD